MKERILIKNGRVIDPKNGVDRVANLLISKGKVEALTDREPDADTIIDGTGKIVCPGFVDLHMHEDPWDKERGVLDKSIATSMVRMGVTTAVGGNCGINLEDPLDYLDHIDKIGTAVNIGLMIGHGYLRSRCGGTDKYGPVSAEIQKNMKRLCKDCLDGGCFGVSYGLKYVPGATQEELYGLAGLCKPRGQMISAHVRYDANRVFEAVSEIADVGLALGIPVQNSHIGSMGGYGQMEALLKLIYEYRKKGADLMSDCYPYYAFSTRIGETTYDPGFLDAYDAKYDSIQICDGKYAGQRCTKEIFDELRATAPEVLTVGCFMKPSDVDLALLDPHVIVASDGLRNGSQGHPRAAGTFPRFLVQFAKTGRLELPEAIDKMTRKPAKRLGLDGKGHLTPGADADIVVFDYDRLQDKATFEEPTLTPEGIEWVLLAGQAAVAEGKLVSDTLGRAVRYA